MLSKKTSIEKQMLLYLESLGLKYGSDFFFNYPIPVENDNCKRVDFYLPKEKVIIECDGSYWHRNKWKDKFRDLLLEQEGFCVYHFTDKEIMKEKNRTINILKNILSKEIIG